MLYWHYAHALGERQPHATPDGTASIDPYADDNYPRALRKVVADGAALLRLPDDWDGHGGKPVSQGAFQYLTFMLCELMRDRSALPAPIVVPLSYGGMQAEWHTPFNDFEIEVERPNRFRWYFRDRRSGEEEEGAGSSDFAELFELARRLSVG